jgi:protein-disulfide isomerase
MPKSTIILIVLLCIASFLLGTLYTKVQYLEKNGTTAAQPGTVAKKYKSFEDAMAALAKSIKLDGNKLVACMNSGSKASVIAADVAEGNAAGVNGTPAFFINGRLLGGAFPYESFKEVIDKELAGTGSNNVTDYSQTLQDAAKQGAFDPKIHAVSVGNAHTIGKAGAPITIVEFSDFQCPYCERAYPVVKQVLKDYGDKVLLAYKQFPLVTIHPRAQKSAEAAACASDQGKFWEMHNALFENQSDWSSL